MALYINNRTSETVNLSLLILDHNCTVGGQPWRKEGWWVMKAGQTTNPAPVYVNLTTINGWIGIYAYTASGDKSWQGTGNAWFEVTNGGAFNQCGENNSNCPKWVDYYGVTPHGSDFVTYIGPNANEVSGSAPTISIVAGENGVFGPSFYISGAGFIPGSTVTVGWEYVYGDGVAENLTAATENVGSDGTFSDIISVYWITYTGTLSVKAVDSAWGLTATASENVN
jgi:hypothetical protein